MIIKGVAIKKEVIGNAFKDFFFKDGIVIKGMLKIGNCCYNNPFNLSYPARLIRSFVPSFRIAMRLSFA